MLRLTRNTYQHGWIETRPSKKQDLVFVYRWRKRKPDGGYTKRSEVIGPVSMLKTEANAWRAIEHRKLDVNSDHPQGQAVTIGMLVSRYLETELPSCGTRPPMDTGHTSITRSNLGGETTRFPR